VIRDLTNELIDTFIDAGEIEAYSQFCAPLPSRIFIDLLGLPPRDLSFFQAFKDGVIRPEGTTPEEMGANAAAAAQRMRDYLNALIDERERTNDVRDDLIGGFLEVEVDGHRLDRTDMLNVVLLLVIAGLDTVVASLSNFLMFLGRNPSYRHQLVEDPSLIAGAVEELLRFESPVQQGVRKSTADLVLPSGAEIRAGELIQTVWAAANVDPREFDNPTQADFRRFPNRHIAFASGTHRCLVSHLARMELRLAMEEWHKRIPEYRVADDSQIQMINFGVRTMFHLPLVLGS
jgi:cytochrome P450